MGGELIMPDMTDNEISFDKYIDNPMGGAVLSNRNMYINLYTAKFDELMVREDGKMQYTVFKDSDDYIIHLKVPSEALPDFYYDVVVRLYTKVSAKKANMNLRRHAAQFFSNDPAFIYTFAYAFKTKDMFVKDLSSKLPKKTLSTKFNTSEDRKRNPNHEISYVKSLFFAYIMMNRQNLFDRNKLDAIAVKYSRSILLRDVSSFEDKNNERYVKQYEKDNPNKKSTKILKKEPTNRWSSSKGITRTSTVAKTSVQSKMVNKTKTTRTVKRK
jgi:hypothetical protein